MVRDTFCHLYHEGQTLFWACFYADEETYSGYYYPIHEERRGTLWEVRREAKKHGAKVDEWLYEICLRLPVGKTWNENDENELLIDKRPVMAYEYGQALTQMEKGTTVLPLFNDRY